MVMEAESILPPAGIQHCERALQPKPSRVKGKVKEFTVNRQMARQGVDRLKGRYFDIAKPLLHAKVEPHRNTLPPFELGD